MSTDNTSWFHCGRCGSLFQSAPGESDDRLCPACGCNPCTGTEAVAAPVEAVTPYREAPMRDGASARRKKVPARGKRSYLVAYLAVGWLALLAVIVFSARHFWGAGKDDSAARAAVVAKDSIPAEDLALVEGSALARNTLFSKFMAADSPEARNQFVSSPIDTAARMARFYSMNPMPVIDPGKLKLIGSSVIHIPGKTAIESQVETSGGQAFDVVQQLENDEWRIDWDHFVRYSETPWTLFLAGNGDAEGEFRLLARERLADERKDKDRLSLVFYAPRFGHDNETGLQSPEFIIPRDSRNARLLEAAFALQRADRRVFDIRLPNPNPEGLIRVRVRIHRSEVDKVRRFELTEVIACHWFNDDHPGVDPDAAAGKTGEVPAAE